MIRSIRNRGLKRLYERGDKSLLNNDHVNRIEDIIARLDIAASPPDMDLPGYGLHRLKGSLKGFWAVRVSGNWRIIFRFKEGDAFDVNLIDYQ